MAFFTPDLDLRITDRCSTFQIQDKTGVDTGDGTKWEGGTGLDVSNLTAANIRVVAPDGTYSDHDVLSQIPDPVTGEFWFDDVDATGVDGLHNLVYTLQTSNLPNGISAFADYGATVTGAVKVTATAHTLQTGMYVEITGTTNYNSIFYVTKIDADNFYITATWAGDDGAATGIITYRSTFFPYVHCRVEAATDKMMAMIAIKLPSTERSTMLEDAITAKGLLDALKSAITSSNISACDRILEEINSIVDFYEVDANLS